MSDSTSQPDDAVDRWLADQRRAVIDDLASTLDLEAGLCEAMTPARHADLVADLRDVLDIEAGLSAVVSATPASSSEADSEKAPPDPQLPTDLPGLVLAIVSASPTSRLAMRSQPTLVTIQALACAHDHADRLARDLDRVYHAHFGALAPSLDFDLALARNRALDLNSALDLTRDLVLPRAVALDMALDIALARALDLTRDLDRALDLDPAVDRALDLTRDLVLPRAVALDLVSALDEIHRALSDFTGADLRDADLTGVSLVGLRWSVTTRWPTDWVEQIERDSVEVEPGIFEVRGGTTYAPTTV